MRRVAVLVAVATVAAGGCPFGSGKGVKTADFLGAAAGGGERVPAPSPNPDWEGDLPAAVNTSDPFVAMNDYFQTLYTSTGNAVRPTAIVTIENDYIVLSYGGQRLVEPATTMEYHNLKMVSHVPLAAFMILLRDLYGTAPSHMTALSNITQANLASFLTVSETAYADMLRRPDRFSPGPQYERQVLIFSKSLSFMRGVLAAGETSLAALGNFTYSLLDPLNDSLNEAAVATVNSLYTAMEKWRTTVVAPADWATLRAIVTTSHMARRASMYSQFFARYWNVSTIQSDRFITLEEVSGEAAVFTLLDTHVTDYAIGDLFFNDHFRMHQDALCAGAKRALDVLFPDNAAMYPGCFKDPSEQLDILE